MKIRLDKAIVEFVPENPAETAELEALWVRMGNCIGNTKQLEPIGVYQPTEKNVARFHINGLTAEEEKAVPAFIAGASACGGIGSSCCGPSLAGDPEAL